MHSELCGIETYDFNALGIQNGLNGFRPMWN
jgi:hypothetical protein